MLAVLVVAPLLGLDNFAAAMGLPTKSVAALVRVTAAFSVGAPIASAAGLLAGRNSASALGGWGQYAAGAVLRLVGLP